MFGRTYCRRINGWPKRLISGILISFSAAIRNKYGKLKTFFFVLMNSVLAIGQCLEDMYIIIEVEINFYV